MACPTAVTAMTMTTAWCVLVHLPAAGNEMSSLRVHDGGQPFPDTTSVRDPNQPCACACVCVCGCVCMCVCVYVCMCVCASLTPKTTAPESPTAARRTVTGTAKETTAMGVCMLPWLVPPPPPSPHEGGFPEQLGIIGDLAGHRDARVVMN
jgi:hypothetical protein